MKFRGLIVLLILLGSVGGAHGFSNTIQRTSDDVMVYTTETAGTGGPTATFSTVNVPVLYPTSNTYYMRAWEGGGYGGWGRVRLWYDTEVSTDYIMFTVRPGSSATGGNVEYTDSVGNILKTIQLPSITSFPATVEIIRTASNEMIVYVDGTQISNEGVFNTDSSLIKIVVDSFGVEGNKYLYVDDITTSHGITGMNDEWDETDANIDLSYGIGEMYKSASVPFPDETINYTLTSKKLVDGTTTNTTIISNDYSAGDTPSGFIRWNRSAIYGLDYGTYLVDLKRDGSIIDSTYFNYAYSGAASGTLVLDGESYSQGQTAIATYALSSPDFSGYTYKIKTYDVYATTIDTHTISSSSGTINQALLDYDAGLYYFVLLKESKVDGSVSELAYDYASVSETVYIHGNVTEAVSGTNMHNASVNYLQGTTYYNTTSAFDGTYNVSDLSATISTTVNSNVTYVNDSTFGNESYNLSSFSFTPLAAQVYTVDLILFNVNHTYDNVSAYGLIYDSIYHQPINNATVNIYNATWSGSTTSTATGYYVFNGLIASGGYSINASATGYTDTIDYSINTTTINATRQDIPMSTLYTVTVKAKDATTTAYLSDFTATLDGVEVSAIGGVVTFSNVAYGLHAISAVASDYYPSASTPLIDEDTEVVLSLTRTPSQYYAPHNVIFTLKSLFGTLYSGVTTNVYIGDTASGDVYKTGTSGTDGAVVFELSEDVQYTLTFIDASQGINEEITIYPVKSEYPVYIIKSLLPRHEDVETTEVVVSITQAEINNTHAYINVTYTDAMAETTDLNIFINQSNEADPQNQTVITSAALGATSSVTHSFLIGDYRGQAYFINIEATHTTFDTISRTYSVRFDGMAEDYGFERFWLWLGVGGLMFLAGIFKSSKAEKGALIVCIAGWIFVGMGLFDALGSGALTGMKAGLGLATVLAVMANMSKKDRDETV